MRSDGENITDTTTKNENSNAHKKRLVVRNAYPHLPYNIWVDIFKGLFFVEKLKYPDYQIKNKQVSIEH